MSNSVAVSRVVILEMIRRKDVYVLLLLTGLVTLLLGSVNLFDDPHISRYIKEICLTLIWISSIAIAVSVAARQIPAERESGTIFPLLAKPITRWEFVLGKFLGCWFTCCASLFVFYTFYLVIGGTRDQAWPLISTLQALWLHCMFCGIVVALTILGSVVWTAFSSNMTFTVLIVVGILLLGRHLHKVAVQVGGFAAGSIDALYFSIPHLEWFDVRDLIVHNWPPIGWGVVSLDTLYGAFYAGLFLLLAWIRFRRMALH